MRAALGLLLAALCIAGARAETLKIGLQKTSGNAAVYIAIDKGYFAAAGLAAELVFFEAGQPVAVATVSGDIDVGVAGLTGGLYALASQGALRIVAGQTREAPGFQANGVVASNRAYAAGLRTLADLPDHSVAITQIGSAFHYDLGLIAAKYGFDLKRVRLLPLQTNPNSVSAVTGGSADAAVTVASYVLPTLGRSEAKLLAWVGDETPWQLAAVFVAAKTADERGGFVERFLRAYRQGAREYHDAVADAEGRRRDGPNLPEVAAIIAHHTGETPERIRLGLSYVDPEGRIDIADIARQLAWYRAQGMVKPGLDADAIVDRRYALPLE